ncbi:GNAT family N-acetyltransferase [Aeromonas diversa]|uniref:GNAT family N-acetyltransferase n=1 Tax=Aeromonas diversa TaxID=502790 RepID=UPI0039A19430
METHPAISTDLLFDSYQGLIQRLPDCWAISTPDTPDYYFGNYLLLPTPPDDRDKGWLEQTFDRLIGQDPRIRHRTFLWPLGEGQNRYPGAFIACGYHYMECLALSLRLDRLIPPAGLSPLTVRAFTPDDWPAWIELELTERNPAHEADHYHQFLGSRERLYRAMIEDGLGQWWGMWDGGELVASCGLFFTETLGRFQWVRTREGWRNRGLCRHLLHQVALAGLERVKELIIVADSDYHAQGVYRRLGFEPVARTGSLCRWETP